MCDTFIINKDNKRYFLKNSDRSPNEPNLLEYVPRMIHEEKTLKCTYIEIPQVKETYEMILVKPSFIYGAEMGFNEYGVSIGNEAVFTKTKSKKESLIGMDYLRLGLERGRSAREAADVIIDLLKEYSQGGNCGFDHNFYYNNSYLIMDKNESYLLETVNKDYCLKKIEGSYNISNRLTISKDYQESSRDFVKGFKEENTNKLITYFSCAKKREEKGRKLIEETKLDILSMINILSDHNKKNAREKGDCSSICMHKALIGDHTTGSMIVDYNREVPTIWLSSGMSPCISVFKPYYLGQTSFVKYEKSDSLNYTLKRMYLSRLVLSNYVDTKEYDEIRKKLQNNIVEKEDLLSKNNPTLRELNNFSKDVDTLEEKFVNLYKEKIEELKNGKIRLHGRWNKLTKNMSKNPFRINSRESSVIQLPR